MDKLMFEQKEWKEYFLDEVVSIDSGKRLTKADMQIGNIPFVGASEMNNGVTAFTASKNDSFDSNVLGVNYNGSVGYSFYHPYKAIFSDDVKRVKWLDSSRNNKYTLLFLSSVIKQQKGKFAYGYKFNAQRMKRQKILLPTTKGGDIDWAFMEDFMKHIELQLLNQLIVVYRSRVCNYLNISKMGGGKME